MRLRTVALGGIALCALTACTAPLEELRQVGQGTGSQFTQSLAEGYRAFADAEAKEYDWIDSRHFAQKGLAAAQGKVVLPENPADWGTRLLPVQVLTDARTRLTNALDSGGRNRNPAVAAKAQVGYDCWLEQLEEGWQTKDIEACRTQFETNLAELEGAKPAAPTPTAAEAVDRFTVFFDFADSQLSPIALSIVEEAAAAAKSAKGKILVLGHADRSGTNETNLRLSTRRADVVTKALVRFGVPANRIDTIGLGESEPLVATPDGVREPQNRRTIIRFP